MQNFFRFLGRDVGSIHHAAYILALSTLLSQLLGLLRDRLLAGTFGAGEMLDVYYSAFRVQDFIFYVVASLLSLAVLIPLLSEALEEGGKEKAKRLLNSLLTITFVLVGAFTLLAFLSAPLLARWLFPGIIESGSEKILVELMRLLLLSPFFFSFSGLLASVTQIYNRFYLTAIQPVLYNIGIIFGIVFLYPSFGLKGVVFGVLIGAFLHMAVQIPFVLRQGLMPRPTLSVSWGDIRRVGLLSVYRGTALGINQLVLLFLTGYATTIAIGAVSVMTFAQNIQSIPLALVGASYSIATFPILSRIFSKGDFEAFVNQIGSITRHIIFWSLPMAVLFIVLRAQMVRVVLGAGLFDWGDTRLTAACLALFVVSVAFQGLSLLYVRGFYAAGRNREALLIGLVSALFTVIFAYVGTYIFNHYDSFRYFLEHLLRVEDLPGSAVLMLPLAFSIGAIVNAALFIIFFKRAFGIFSLALNETVFHSFSASVLMGFVTYQFLDYFGTLFNLHTFIGIFLQGLLSGVLGILSGIVLLYMLKNREFLETAAALRRRFTKDEIVGGQEV